MSNKNHSMVFTVVICIFVFVFALSLVFVGYRYYRESFSSEKSEIQIPDDNGDDGDQDSGNVLTVFAAGEITYSQVEQWSKVGDENSDDYTTGYYIRLEDGDFTGLPAGYYALYGSYKSDVYTFWLLGKNGIAGVDYVLDSAETSPTVWGVNIVLNSATDGTFDYALYTVIPS